MSVHTLDRWVSPNPKHPEWPNDCVGSVAVADGVVYAAVHGAGVFAIPCPHAKAEPFDRGAPPQNASNREPYSVDASAWHVWKPRDVGQARGVAVRGDVVYAACGDAGLYAQQILPDIGFSAKKCLPIRVLSALCGFGIEMYAKRVFKRMAGLTMSRFRGLSRAGRA